MSGITFVLMPPCTTLGEIVVWVQAWSSLAVRRRQLGQRVEQPVGVEQALAHRLGQAGDLEPGRPQLVEAGLRPVGGEAASRPRPP